jgi:transposase
MEVLYSRCCGLDVHKTSVSACVVIREAGRTQRKFGRFGTMTRDLVGLAGWLHELGVTHVAMESTGVYWKSVWNVLEGQFQLILVNAQHVKNVPGRKTDVKDSEWIAELLQHGLLHPSFVPEIRIRDLRDLTRSRASLYEEASRIVSRIQKVLEDANVKMASVATNTVGKSGLAMLEALIAGESDSETLATSLWGTFEPRFHSFVLHSRLKCAIIIDFCSKGCCYNDGLLSERSRLLTGAPVSES